VAEAGDNMLTSILPKVISGVLPLVGVALGRLLRCLIAGDTRGVRISLHSFR
jgi:hypothetical protein